MSACSTGAGRVIAGEADSIWIPRLVRYRYPILYFPPGAGTGDYGDDPVVDPGTDLLFRSLSEGGAVVVVSDYDGHAFGRDALCGTSGHIETFRTTLLSALAPTWPNGSIIDTSKLVLAGHSQGATDAIRYAQANPTHCAAVGTVAGVFDLIGFYTGTYRWGGDAGTANQGQIGTAWGVTYPTALPSAADPYNNAAAAASIPTWIGYSAGDTTVTPAQCQAMATAIGSQATTVKVSDTEPHGDPEAGEAAYAGLVPWLLQHAA